jgi:hypothetical protein
LKAIVDDDSEDEATNILQEKDAIANELFDGSDGVSLYELILAVLPTYPP